MMIGYIIGVFLTIVWAIMHNLTTVAVLEKQINSLPTMNKESYHTRIIHWKILYLNTYGLRLYNKKDRKGVKYCGYSREKFMPGW